MVGHMRGKDVLQQDSVCHPHLVHILLFSIKSFCPHPLNSKITGCPVFTEIFQEPLEGTSISQLLMTNDSFSSQTWAILYLNETLIKSQYRTQPNDSPVRCQNCGYQQYLIKIHKKIFFFTNLE